MLVMTKDDHQRYSPEALRAASDQTAMLASYMMKKKYDADVYYTSDTQPSHI